MRPLAWLSPLLLSSLVSAQPAPLQGPTLSGAPLAARPVEPSLVPVSRELLSRWGIAVEKYLALPEAEKLALQRQLTAGEANRRARLARLRELVPDRWHLLVTPEGWPTPAALRLLQADEELVLAEDLKLAAVFEEGLPEKPSPAEMKQAQERLAALFDGMRRTTTGPSVRTDAYLRGNQVRRARVTNEDSGVTLEIGQLGLDDRSGLLGPSPYVSVTKKAAGVKRAFKWEVESQFGVVDLEARYFADRKGVDLPALTDLAKRFDVPAEKLEAAKGALDYQDPYVTRAIVVASVLAQVGDAYTLYGPVDVGWAVSNVTKFSHLFPSTAFDGTLGARIRLGPDAVVGLYGGLTNTLSGVSNRLLAQVFSVGGPKPGLAVERSPHAGMSLSGALPLLSGLRYETHASRQWNKDTTLDKAGAALLTEVRKRPLRLGAEVSREDGPAIEFRKEKARADVSYYLTDQLSVYAALEKSRWKFGNAEVCEESVLAGGEYRLGPKDTVRVDELFGRARFDDPRIQAKLPDLAAAVNKALDLGLEIAPFAALLSERVGRENTPQNYDLALDKVSRQLNLLPPDVQASVFEELKKRGVTPQQGELLGELLLRTVPEGGALHEDVQAAMEASGISPEWVQRITLASDWVVEHRDDIQAVLDVLARPEVWEEAGVRAGRMMAIRELGRLEIPIYPEKGLVLKLTPPVVLAAANALNSGASPLAPLRQADLPATVEPWLLREAGRSLGLDGAPTADQVSERLFELAETQLKDRVRDSLSAQLDRALATGQLDPAEVARTVNAAVPPETAAQLTARYGVDFERLLPRQGTPEELRRILLADLPDEAAKALRRELGPEIRAAVAQMTAWAAEFLRRELNTTMIRTLMASETLNRLTVEKGLEPADHSVAMVRRSFGRLDPPRQSGLRQMLRASAERLAQETRLQDERIAGKLTAYGQARLDRMKLQPSWPAGFDVQVADADWAPLLAAYGDGPLFDLVADAARAHAQAGRAPRTVRFAFDAGADGTRLLAREGGVVVELPPVRGLKDPAWLLKTVEGALQRA